MKSPFHSTIFIFSSRTPKPTHFQIRRFTSSTTLLQWHSSSSPPFSYPSRRHEDESRLVRVSVWWDFENCQIPANTPAFRVPQTITAAIRANGIKGPIQITAFGDVMQMSKASQEALSSTGVNLSHVPNGFFLFLHYFCL